MALDATINVGLDGSQVAEGVKPIARTLENLGKTAQRAGQDASKGIASIGEGGAASAAKVEASTKNMIGAIQRTTAAMEAGKKSGSEYYEALAKQRGIDVGALRPYLAQLDAVNAKQEAAARSAEFANKAFLAIGAAVGIGAVGFVRMIDGAIEAADSMRDLSKTTGIAVEDLAGLKLAAQQSGGDLDGIAKSLNKLSVNIGKDGEKFRALGITAKEPLEAFKQLSDIFASIDDPQRRAALGAAALGKSWESAAPLMSEGSKAIGEMVEKGARLSGITSDMADEADKFNDSMAELTARVDGFKTKVAGDMLPALNQIVPAITLAYEESGKLAAVWAALGALGTFAFTDEFDATATKIRTLKDELQTLEDNRAHADDVPLLSYLMWGNPEAWDADILAKKRQIFDLIETTKPKEKAKPKAEDPESVKLQKQFIKDQEDAAKKAESIAESAEKARQRFIDSVEKEGATYGKTTTQIKLYEAGLLRIKGKQLEQIKATLGNVDAQKQAAESAKEQSKMYQALADERTKIIDAANAEALKNEELAATYGLSKDAIEELTLARLEDRLSQRLSLDLSEEDVQQTEKLIAAKKRSIAALRDLGDKEAAKKQFDNLAAESQKFTDGLYQGLSDALMRGFESGKGFFQNFWESIKNLFKTTVLKMTVQGVMGGVTGLTSGVASAGNLSQLGNIGGIAGGIGSIGSGVSSLGIAAGSTSLAGFGMGLQGSSTLAGSTALSYGVPGASAGASTAAMATTAATIAAGVIAGVYGGRAVSGGYSTGGSGNAMVNGGTAIGAGVGAIMGGPFGAALGAAIGGVVGGGVNRLFGYKDKVYGAAQISGVLGADDLKMTTGYTQKGGYFRSDKSGSVVGAADSTLSAGLKAGYDALKTASADYAKALGLNAASIATRTDSISFSVGKSAEEQQANIAKMFQGIGDSIAGGLLGNLGALQKDGELASETLARLGTSITAANLWLGRLKINLFGVSTSGADAASKLADAFGGLQNMAQASQSFYELYYTEAERAAQSNTEMAASLALVNLAVPESKEQFKSLVGSLDLNTEAGRKAYVALMAIAPVFSETSAKLAELSKAAAVALLSAFTGNGALIPALDAASLKTDTFGASVLGAGIAASGTSTKFDAAANGIAGIGGVVGGVVTKFDAATGSLTGTSTAIAGAVGKIDSAGNSIGSIASQFLDASAGLIDFSDAASGLSPKMTAAQLSAELLTDQIIGLKQSADKAKIDFAGLGAAMAGLDTQTFINTMGLVFENLGNRIKGVIESISTERVALREAALQIVNPTVLSKDAIQRGIAGINTALPSNAGIVQAAQEVSAKDAAIVSAQSALDVARSTLERAQLDALWYASDYFNQYAVEAAAAQKKVADATVLVSDASAAVTAAQAAQATSIDHTKAAQLAYASALQDFTIDASKSVGRLSKLREETLKYYEAQKQLAELMSNSAANLRGTVATYKYDQLSPEQQFAELQAKYTSSYSMALSTSGTDLAGYGDKLNSMLNPLLEKAKEIYGSGTAYDAFVATTIARADNIAGRLELLTPTNYAADSLSMLGQIDATLVALDAASKSAEKIISDAIKAGADQTSAGLHAIVAALTGQAVPAFAAGGDFGGGLRLVGENGPELEATGASRIFNAEQTRSMLSGGSSTAKLEALVARQTQELANMRAELRAIATTNNKMLKLADRAEKDGMLIRNEEPITTVAA